MSDRYFNLLVELSGVVRHTEQPTQAQWGELEEHLGIALPDDLKHLVSALGSGHFGEFCLLNPASSSEYVQFTPRNVLGFGSRISQIASKAGIALYPDREGFLLIGVCGNNMDLLLQPRWAAHPPYELAWLELDYSRAHAIKTGLCQFLYELYQRLIPEPWVKGSAI